MALQFPQTPGSGAVGRGGWFGEKEVAVTIWHLGCVPFLSAFPRSPHFLLGFPVNPTVRIYFSSKWDRGNTAGPGVMGLMEPCVRTMFLQHFWYTGMFICSSSMFRVMITS